MTRAGIATRKKEARDVQIVCDLTAMMCLRAVLYHGENMDYVISFASGGP
jgi:hypothetical protein